MVRLTVVPVIPLASSEAMKAATFAISSSVMSRRGWVLLASISCHCSQVSPDASSRYRNARRRLQRQATSSVHDFEHVEHLLEALEHRPQVAVVEPRPPQHTQGVADLEQDLLD